MKNSIIILFVIALISNGCLQAQNGQVSTDMEPENYEVYNREVSYNNGVAHLNARQGDGILWLNDSDFDNGTIELEIKGKNAPGQSFVGLAFHGEDNEAFDAVYFRPFNFKNPERNMNSVQYIAMPEYDWSVLREAHPGKYENTAQPTPDPVDDWFSARIVVNHPQVKVYVNGADEPTLEVEQLSERREGKVGFWVGNGSEGWFRNLKITEEINNH